MAEQLSVRPQPGVAFPRAAPSSGFVGYEMASGEPREGDHVVPGGPLYRPKSAHELVPNTVYYRKALQRGDILSAELAEPPLESAG